jgi:hypothetical protein
MTTEKMEEKKSGEIIFRALSDSLRKSDAIVRLMVLAGEGNAPRMDDELVAGLEIHEDLIKEAVRCANQLYDLYIAEPVTKSSEGATA